MNRNQFWAMMVVAATLLIITTGVVFAAGLSQFGPPLTTEDDVPFGGYWGPMHGRGRGWSPDAAVPPMHEAMVEAVASATGLSVADIEARLAEGERLYEIALEAGISEDAFFDLMKAAREAYLTEAFEAGLISEERYQWMLERQEREQYGRGFGPCHSYDEEVNLKWGAGRQRGRGRNW